MRLRAEHHSGEVRRPTIDRQNLVVTVGAGGVVRLEGNELQVDEPLPGHLELPPVQIQKISDLLLAVEADPVPVGGQGQEQVQGLVLVGHDRQVAVA